MTPHTTRAALLLLLSVFHSGGCCQWGAGEELRRFVRVREDAPLGQTLFTINMTHPQLLALQPVSQDSAGMFRVAEGVGGQGRVVVGAPLQPLMLSTSPVTKLTLTCGDNQVSVQVTVYVEDVNDHPPLFMATNITVTVDELTPVGLTILPEIRVTDADKANTANSEVELEIRTGNEGNYFKMSDRKRGSITLAKSLDYDAGPKMFFLGVVAKDMGKPSLSSTSTISVIVLDADDLPPVFSHSHYSAKIAEHPGPDMGMTIHQEVLVSPSHLIARDGDVGRNTTLRYTLVESPAADHFTLDPDTGHLYLTKHLDRENLTDNTLTLHVRAEQVDNARRVGSSVLEVVVDDVNDNLPQFTHDVYAISIVENLPSGFSVVQVSATDPDEGLNGAFNYHVIGGGGALAVNPLSGWLTVANHNMLDREESPIINLHVCANQITPIVKFASNSNITKPSSKVEIMEKSKFHVGLDDEDTVTKISGEFITDDWDAETTEVPLSETSALTKRQQNSTTRGTVPLWRHVARTAHRPVAEHTSSLVPLHARYGRQSYAADTGTRIAKENFEQEAQSDSNSTSKTTEFLEKQTQQQGDPARKPNPSIEKDYGERRNIRSQENRTKEPYISPNISTPLTVSSAVPSTRDTHEEANMRATQEQARQEVVYNQQIANSRFKRETHNQVQRNKSMNSTAIIETEDNGSQRDASFSDFESLSCAKIELKLLDANDNNPVFHPTNQYQFSITEDAQEGHIIGSVLAEDVDEGGNGLVMYKVQTQRNTTRDTLREAVTVDKVQGILMLVSKLPPGQVTVFVEAFDTPSNPSETRTSLAVVNIDVKATHSWEPRFMGAPFELWVGGDAPVGTSVGQVRVVDLPGPELMFDMFHSYSEGVPFAIEESSGIVSVMSPLQQYSRPTYEFEAVVTDGTLSLATNLTIHVAPPPRPTARRNTIIQFTIQENLAGGVVGDLLAALRTIGARIAPDPQFELVSPEARQYFALSQDATLYTVAPLDYETHPNHTLVVVSARTSDIFYIHVQVEDINDNAPQLNAVSYEGIIKENAFHGTVVKILPTVHVYDEDSYPGSSYDLQLLGEAAPLFSIDSSNGHVTFVGEALDREMKEVYNLLLVAKDDGNLTSRANLTITVEDVNDNPPKFTNREPLHSAREEVQESSSRKLPDTSSLEYLADLERSLIHIPESLPIGSRITQLIATDEDKKSNADIHYVIESEKSFRFSFSQGKNGSPVLHETNKFSIEAKTGVISVTRILEPDHFYLLNVSATDGGGLSAYSRVAVAVFDVNDHTPRFERPVYNFEVTEGEYLVGEVGKVMAYDQDMGNNAKVHYQIIFDKNSTQDLVFPFRIIETSGTILATGSVDREVHEMYEFSIVATDMGDPELSSSVLVHIDIIDVNDHSPVFYGYKEVIYPPDKFVNTSVEPFSGIFIPVYMAVVSENASRNTFITKVFANDSDSSSSGNGIILYKLEGGEDKFAIDSKNGSIYTVGSLDYELWPEHNLTVIAQDLGSPSLTASALLMVTVMDVKEELTTRLFDRDEYRVLVTENNNTPLLLVDLNVSDSYAHHRMHYQLADPQMIGTVAVDSHSGEVYLIASLDRETKDKYHFKVRAIQPDHGRALEHFHQQTRDLDFLEYTVTSLPATVSRTTGHHLLLSADKHLSPLTNVSDHTQRGPKTNRRVPTRVSLESFSSSGQRLGIDPDIPDVPVNYISQYNSEGNRDNSASVLMDGAGKLGLDEVWVIVEVEDQNDNSPRFNPHIRPIVAAVPASAAYGHFVTRITAQDPDLGVNGEVRYEILPGEGAQDATTRFTIDPTTGQVVVVGALEDVAGRMFGFDVRATDQQGAPNGRTAIANVFVHVLGAGRHLVVEVGATPRDVEPHLHHIQGTLTNVSGLDVRVQRIAPHVDGDAAHTTATDVYVYAVDPVTQAVVDAAQLRQALRGRKGQVRSLLPSGLHFRGMRLPLPSKQGHVLQTAELAILVGAVVVFLVTVTAIVCLCYKQRKSRRRPMPLPPLMTAGGVPVMPLAYPGPFGAPYTHMSDHSSADSLEAQELPHDHMQYHHDSASCPQEAAQYSQDFVHYPRPAHKRHTCTHDHHSDHEMQHSCRNEQVSSHTDEDDTVPTCLRQAPSRKRRRGPQAGGVPPNGLAKRTSSRFGSRLQEEPSSSDLDEKDHAPAQISIPRPPWCCADDRQHGGVSTSRALPTVDCSLSSSARPHSPDSLEQPPKTRKHAHSQSHDHIHTIPRTHLKRERIRDQTGRGAGSSGLLPSDVTEL